MSTAETAPALDEALALVGLDAYYGSAQALAGVAISVAAGTTTALLGRNGAGKSTLLKSVAGIEVRTSGSIRAVGVELSGLPAFRRARLGVQLVPEDRRVLASLSVAENVLLGSHALGTREPLELAEIVELLPTLAPLLERRGDQLSGGEQQLVAIARALRSNPRLLLLDEPSEGLAPIVVEQVGRAVAGLRRREGLTLVIAEQNAPFALSLADDVVVLESGRVAFSGSRADFEADPELARRHLAV